MELSFRAKGTGCVADGGADAPDMARLRLVRVAD